MNPSAFATLVPTHEKAGQLVHRASRLWRKGHWRRALLALREACHLDEPNAAYWMIYAEFLRRYGKRNEAEHAMRQALWLRQRVGDRARCQVIRRLLLQLGPA